jgi:hypothetical protein
VHLEGVVAVGLLVGEGVVVGVVPGDPAGGAREQGVVQGLPVVVGRVVVRGEVRGQPELLQHHWPPAHRRQLADEGGLQVLPDDVALHPVDVRPDELHQWRDGAQREAVGDAGGLRAPGAVTERDRLGATTRSDSLHHQLGPGQHVLR